VHTRGMLCSVCTVHSRPVRCNGTEIQNSFSNVNKRIIFVFCCEVQHKWGKENYIDCCIRAERSRTTWAETGIRRGSEKGR
jgi:hypothetical protein